MAIIFGAFLYPKDIKNSIESFDQASYAYKIQKVNDVYDLLHKTLYNFSNNNLNMLLSQSRAFKLAL